MLQYNIYQIYNLSSLYRNRLNQLLYKYTYDLPKSIIQQMYDLIKKRMSDNEIITFITTEFNKKQKKIKYSTNKSAIKKAKVIETLLKSVSSDSLMKPANYLDVGCNNGYLTVEIGKILRLSKNNIYGIDVGSFTYQKIVPTTGFIYNEYDGIHIPFENQKFDFLTLLMVLHHVKYYGVLLTEINRVMKNDGILLIKEHDIFDDPLSTLMLIEHMIYDMAEYAVTYENFINSYYHKTFSKKELIEIMKNHGFTKLDIDPNNAVSQQRYVMNPTQHYYMIFKKNKF